METRTCLHRFMVECAWVNNDGMTAPVLKVSGTGMETVLTLTNETIYVNCPACFLANRRSVEAKYQLAPSSTPLR